jgi:thioredoxin reductase (NADPH)
MAPPGFDPVTAAPLGARHPRHDQMFPVLTGAEIARIRRFGRDVGYGDGDYLFQAGELAPGMLVILGGQVSITARDGLGHVAPIAEQGPGQFVAETGQLTNSQSLVDARAEGPVEALLIDPDRVRALIVAEADLGERIVRALILRTVALLQSGATGPVLVGPAEGRDMARLREFLRRNKVPNQLLDPADSAEARELVALHAAAGADLPLVVAPVGAVLRNPTNLDLGRRLGMTARRSAGEVYDVAVVGAGPAGLATAVYATSEGLSVVVLDARSHGGQAGASARIENYFGFPTGISGAALVGRAYVQAQKFGAEILVPAQVARLDCGRGDGVFGLELDGDAPVRARSVVVASGARYRRPRIDGLERFEGNGVWYWASASETRLCSGEEVIVIGGGNSAGQAAVYLSAHVRQVKMMIRGPGLAQSMSRYLIDRIEATPNIELMTGTEVTGLEGDEALRVVEWRRRDGETDRAPIRHLFIFAGADPATEWLSSCGVTLDRAGFVTTGHAWQGCSDAGVLQTAVPGVFAVGDVRAGSVKRVGSAIGEGAQVCAALHGYLAAQARALGESQDIAGAAE